MTRRSPQPPSPRDRGRDFLGVGLAVGGLVRKTRQRSSSFGRKTSARRTVPSLVSMGTVRSIRMVELTSPCSSVSCPAAQTSKGKMLISGLVLRSGQQFPEDVEILGKSVHQSPFHPEKIPCMDKTVTDHVIEILNTSNINSII